MFSEYNKVLLRPSVTYLAPIRSALTPAPPTRSWKMPFAAFSVFEVGQSAADEHPTLPALATYEICVFVEVTGGSLGQIISSQKIVEPETLTAASLQVL